MSKHAKKKKLFCKAGLNYFWPQVARGVTIFFGGQTMTRTTPWSPTMGRFLHGVPLDSQNMERFLLMGVEYFGGNLLAISGAKNPI